MVVPCDNFCCRRRSTGAYNGFSSLAPSPIMNTSPKSTRWMIANSYSSPVALPSVCFSSAVEEEDETSPSEEHEDKDQEAVWNAMTPESQKLAESILASSTSSSSLTENGCMVHPRVALSRAITLMESKHPKKKQQGDYLLTYLLSKTSPHPTSVSTETKQEPTLRIGFAGPPGAGKSSLMEAFGMYLLEKDPTLKLAVVCIDPSSGISGGSILGDKTRMTELSRHDRAVVRPSANSGVLGGLSAYTDDVVRLLAAAGYPLVMVETVGLGQSEIEIVESVDVMVLLLPPAGGDDLQGVKKGIVEMANILSVTKADGDLEPAAKRTATDYSGALRVLQMSNNSGNNTSGSGDKIKNSDDGPWQPPVILTSSVTQRGLDTLWESIQKYRGYLVSNGLFEERRQNQSKYWMWKQFTRMMQVRMQEDPILATRAQRLEGQMLSGLLTPRVAAQELLDKVFDAAAATSQSSPATTKPTS